MIARINSVALGAGLLLLPLSPVTAQDVDVQFGLHASWAWAGSAVRFVPVPEGGERGTYMQKGFGGGAGVAVSSAQFPLALEVTAGVSGAGQVLMTDFVPGGCGPNCTLAVRRPLADLEEWYGAADLVAYAPVEWRIAPFVSAGLGYRRYEYDVSAMPDSAAAYFPKSESHMPARLGAGIEVSGLPVDVRFHAVRERPTILAERPERRTDLHPRSGWVLSLSVVIP